LPAAGHLHLSLSSVARPRLDCWDLHFQARVQVVRLAAALRTSIAPRSWLSRRRPHAHRDNSGCKSVFFAYESNNNNPNPVSPQLAMEGGGDKSNHAKPSVLTATLRLCFAARLGGVNVARALLAEGPRADAANDNGDTPLHLAAEHGHADMVRALLAAPSTAKGNLSQLTPSSRSLTSLVFFCAIFPVLRDFVVHTNWKKTNHVAGPPGLKIVDVDGLAPTVLNIKRGYVS
jgi:ankyrin repeat protein